MFRLTKPSAAEIDAFLESQSGLSFTYPEVGATDGVIPTEGYVLDREAVVVGHGRAAFEATCELLRGWDQFRLGWTELCWQRTPLRVGEQVAVLAHIGGLWSLNAAQIVYVLDDVVEVASPPDSDQESGRQHRFGLGYGTLPGHEAAGEEQFLVRWNRTTDEVWFSITAFSRPNTWTMRFFNWYARRKQILFKRQSLELVQRLVRQMVSEAASFGEPRSTPEQPSPAAAAPR